MTFWFKSKPKHTHPTNIISISSQKVQTQKYGQEERPMGIPAFAIVN